MQVVWEADTPDFRRRKRAARACTDCQKRKKRCHHTFANRDEDDHRAGPVENNDSLNEQSIAPQQEDTIRFIGHSNPESILTGLADRPEGNTRSCRVGFWIDSSQSAEEVAEDQPHKDVTITQASVLPRQGVVRPPSSALQRYLQEVGVFRVLPRPTQDLLVANYFACIHNVLPLIDGRPFLKALREGAASIFLVQAICLVSSKTQDAASYLRLSENGPVLRPLNFARTLYTGLDAAMKAGLETSQMAKVQILALLSLHNDGPGGIEDASLHLAQAIHHAHSAGFHIESPGRPESDQFKPKLFWCLWSLDKLNACIGGRPIMIADQDIGIIRPAPGSGADQAFDAFMALSDVLAQVIGYYRPTAGQVTGWEEDFPTLDKVSSALPTGVLDLHHSNVLELYYNVIAILTCRSGQNSTASYRRRVSAANRIQDIMTGTTAEHMTPIPVVPYAASLSMTVAYRQLRDSKSADDHHSASADLHARCEILESLSSRWWTADAMAKLGRKALTSLQQPFGDSNKIMTMMEDAVKPCTFTTPSARAKGIGKGAGQHALDVLSSVAEAHAYNTQPQTQPSLHPWPETTGSGDAEQPEEQGLIGMQLHSANNPPLLDPNLRNFHDLDALFGDFFDLSMPTLFEDPLFEGANFFDLPEMQE